METRRGQAGNVKKVKILHMQTTSYCRPIYERYMWTVYMKRVTFLGLKHNTARDIKNPIMLRFKTPAATPGLALRGPFTASQNTKQIHIIYTEP
jgi:hypothetical protein